MSTAQSGHIPLTAVDVCRYFWVCAGTLYLLTLQAGPAPLTAQFLLFSRKIPNFLYNLCKNDSRR